MQQRCLSTLAENSLAVFGIVLVKTQRYLIIWLLAAMVPLHDVSTMVLQASGTM